MFLLLGTDCKALFLCVCLLIILKYVFMHTGGAYQRLPDIVVVNEGLLAAVVREDLTPGGVSR